MNTKLLTAIKAPPVNSQSPEKIGGKLEVPDLYLPKDRMVSTSQKQHDNDKGVDTEDQPPLYIASHPRRRIQGLYQMFPHRESEVKRIFTPKTRASQLCKCKEMNLANLTCIIATQSIGSGIFGTCYSDKYQGIQVVIKEYRERDGLSRIQREARCNKVGRSSWNSTFIWNFNKEARQHCFTVSWGWQTVWQYTKRQTPKRLAKRSGTQFL